MLLFDEPLSNLDAKLRVQMREEIRTLQKRLGITTVYVTHDQEEAMAISDRIAVMNAGTIAQLGDAEELYRRPASAFVAGFIGRANVIDATVESVDDARIGLLVAGQRHAVESADTSLRAGMAVRAVIRPEAISVAAQGEGISGTVVIRTYLGDKIEYVVDVGGARIQVAKSNPRPGERLMPGDTVAVGLPVRDIQLLPGDKP